MSIHLNATFLPVYFLLLRFFCHFGPLILLRIRAAGLGCLCVLSREGHTLLEARVLLIVCVGKE
jgi:hypothetical protein